MILLAEMQALNYFCYDEKKLLKVGGKSLAFVAYFQQKS
jgi:hypothetical protein